jgi:O-antigen ligase
MAKLLEILISLYCFFGMLTGIYSISYLGTALSFVIQLLALYYVIVRSKFKVLRKPAIIYLINLSIIFSIFIILLLSNYSLVSTLYRTITLLSIFGLTIVFCISEINYKTVIKNTLLLFALLGMVIFIDSMRFILFDVSVWGPETYVTNRFSGPFFDSNFLSITYAILFIMVLFGKYFGNTYKKYLLTLFAILILLGGSWSAISILLISLFLGYFIRNRNFGKKQIIIILIYVIGVLATLGSLNTIENSFNNFTANLGVGVKETTAKYLSFENRIVVQNEALNGVVLKPFGHGPQSIVNNVGRDTHNSYIGVVYELGILGLCLLLINVTYRRHGYDRMLNILTTYFFFIALTINIHYSSIYFLLLILMNESKNIPSQVTKVDTEEMNKYD